MTKLVTTDLDKLVSWHTDTYQLFSDDACLICLTEKEKYLLGNALRQMRWSTRWVVADGDTLPDIDAIASELEHKLMDCTDFCAEIIACLNDPTSGVADAIINIYNDSDTVSDMAQNQSGLLLGDGNNVTCDKDVWYGGIEHLVGSIHEHNQDALQILEVATNVYEWIGQVATGIFGIEAPIIQSMLDWGAFIQQSIMENYEAQWTQQYRETIVCDLLCIAMENCELTPELLVNYFYERLSSQLTFGSLLDESLEFIFLGSWVGTEIVDAMILSQLAFRAQLGRWFDLIAFNSIDTDIRLGFDNASNDWSLICNACGWDQSWYSGNGDPVLDGWTYFIGVYDAVDDDGQGVQNSTSISVHVEFAFTSPVTLTRIFHDGTLQRVSGSSSRTMRIKHYDDSLATWTDLAIVTPTAFGTVPYSLNWVGSQVFDIGDILRISCGVADEVGNSAEMKHITVEGEGDNPF